ncbi:MAG TPA: hypothetical protein VF332_00275 [Vicinamibacterales bacterium]
MNGARPGEDRPSAHGLQPARRWWRRVLVVAWIAGAVVVWNMVFDAHIVKGARNYVDRQQLFIEGRGPHVDMGGAMDEAKAAGLRAASLWAGAELASGLALAGAVRIRNRRRDRDGLTRASR